MSINAVSSSPAANQAIQASQQKAAQAPQNPQPPKQDTVHLHSAATGDVDHDGDSH
jgi:hypothetical protein